MGGIGPQDLSIGSIHQKLKTLYDRSLAVISQKRGKRKVGLGEILENMTNLGLKEKTIVKQSLNEISQKSGTPIDKLQEKDFKEFFPEFTIKYFRHGNAQDFFSQGFEEIFAGYQRSKNKNKLNCF
jgi:hypothetical protein